VAAWSDSILDDAVEFAKAHQHIFTGNNPPVGKSQLYGLMNLVQNTSNFGRVRYFTDHQAQKAEGRRNNPNEFWVAVGKKLDEFAADARSLADKSGLSVLPETDRPELDDLHRALAVEYLQHLTAEILLISQQETWDQRRPQRRSQPARHKPNNATNRR
jgi:hypothetical protein